MTKRLVAVVAMAAVLGGCSIFKGGEDKKPKTAVLGERIPVLTTGTDTAVEPTLAETVVTVPEPVENADWAQPGGNSAKAVGHVALGATVRQAWSQSVPGGSSKERLASGPVIAGGRVYLVDALGTVRAFDARTGAPVWRTPLAGDAPKRERVVLYGGGASVEGDRVYATDGRGDAAALEAATGKIVWKVRPAGPLRGAPGVGLGNVFVQTQDNQLFALKADTGATVWTASATLETAGVFGVAAPAIAQGTVVAGFSSGELSALRYENGRVVWQDQLARTSISTSVSTISDIDASPVIDQGVVYAIGQGGRMVAMSLTGGQRLWELSIGGISTPWLAGDWLFVVTDEAKLFCVSRLTGKVRWMTQLPRFRDPKGRNKPIAWYGPVLAGGRLILVNSLGQMVDVAVADGKVARTIKAGKGFYLPPVVAGNTLYLLDGSGKLTGWR